jgi:hypothetical protein
VIDNISGSDGTKTSTAADPLYLMAAAAGGIVEFRVEWLRGRWPRSFDLDLPRVEFCACKQREDHK